MKAWKKIVTAAVALGGLTVGGLWAQSLSGKVAVDGSSTVYPITEAVAEEFGKTNRGVRVTVGISGTGGGFKRFTAGDLDISDASRPIKSDEVEKAQKNRVEYIELPVALDGLTIVVNPANDWCTDLTVAEIKKIFTVTLSSGGAPSSPKVQKWSDVRPGWPGNPIKFYIPGTDSGTFDYFKEVVAGKEKAIRPDVSASEDDNVLVRGVSGDKNAIGFFGYAYYVENKDKVKAVAIDGGKGPVQPSIETVNNGTYSPFSRPLFIYVGTKAAQRPEVDAFVKFYLKNVAKLAAEVGYIALPDEIAQRVVKNYEVKKTGTQFGGSGAKGALTDQYK